MGDTEHLADAVFEVLERQRVVVGIERALVPLVGEALGERVRLVTEVLVARVRVGTEVLVVVTPLEVLVHLDHPVHLVAHVRPEDLGRDARVVGHADRLADVVAERGDDQLVVGAGALGERGGLQRVRELVDREAVGDAGEAPQQAEHRFGHALLVGEGLLDDHAPLLGGGLVHRAVKVPVVWVMPLFFRT